MKDDILYLIHIRECIDRIEEYVRGGRAGFMEDRRTQDAVIRNLQVLAESSQRLSEEWKSKHPEIEWKGISGLRNILVHNYLGVDIEQVWLIVETDLPLLKQAVQG